VLTNKIHRNGEVQIIYICPNNNMSQGKIESAEIEAVSDGGSDVLEPDAGPDLETDNQDSSSEDNEQENGSMEVDESQNNNNEENSNE
jgi:hypothetical protein